MIEPAGRLTTSYSRSCQKSAGRALRNNLRPDSRRLRFVSEGPTAPKGIIRTIRGGVRRAKKTISSWKQAKVLLEQWRRDLTNVSLELKRPRVIGVVPIEFVSGEPVEREGTPTNRFRGQVVYFTNADVTVRLPSGAILVIDNYEIIAMSAGKKRFEPV